MIRIHQRGGASLIGLLVSMACLVVLFAVVMTAMNKAVTGEGSVQKSTLRSMEDQLKLAGIMQSMAVYANEHRDEYLVPSRLAGREDDFSLNISASFWSALVALEYVKPEHLISGNEYSGYVEPCYDYDYTAYSPVDGVFWDDGFQADLNRLSHVSFAHMPMYGQRFDAHWRQTLGGRFPVIGNRGPKDGIDDPMSYTYGRNGDWAGHMAYGDGHVDFIDTFVPAGLTFERDGEAVPDNVFALEDGPSGGDAIIAFTKEMTASGPQLQWD